MSYSFNVTGADKTDAVAKASAELDKVVESQPVHEGDRAAAQAAVEAFVGLVKDPGEAQAVYVSVNGSVYKAEDGFQSASVGVSVSLIAKSA